MTTNIGSTIPINTAGTDDHLVIQSWSAQEAAREAAERQSAVMAARIEERHPSRRGLHRFINLVSAICALAALNMAMGQFLGIAFQVVGPIQYVLRIYVILLCLLVILVEAEWTKMGRDSTVLRIWITRGMFYAFIGCLGLEENDTSTSRNSDLRGFSISLQYIKVVAWIMVVMGMLYFFMGLFCLQFVYNRQRTNYENRMQRAAELRRNDPLQRDHSETAAMSSDPLGISSDAV